MSHHDPTAPFPAPPVTVEFQPLPSPPPEDDYIDDDDEEEWVNKAPKGLRIPPFTGILVLVLFAVCGLWGGAVLQKHHDKKTATTAASTAGAAGGTAAAARRGFGGGTGGVGAGAGAGRTIGTVSDVEGSTVYVTDSTGAIVKINLAPATKITKTITATAADIQLGQAVVVTGAKGTDGSTSASTVIISPAAPGGLGPAAGTAPGTGTGGTGTGAGG